MPNHIHRILILDKPHDANDTKSANCNGNDNGDDDDNGGANAETRLALSLQQRFQNQGKNVISSIVGSYKSAVTNHANRLGFEFGWQSLFHDHIIRNDVEYQRISDYIGNNPANWQDDKFYN